MSKEIVQIFYEALIPHQKPTIHGTVGFYFFTKGIGQKRAYFFSLEVLDVVLLALEVFEEFEEALDLEEAFDEALESSWLEEVDSFLLDVLESSFSVVSSEVLD